jgi:hypothetical protein
VVVDPGTFEVITVFDPNVEDEPVPTNTVKQSQEA